MGLAFGANQEYECEACFDLDLKTTDCRDLLIEYTEQLEDLARLPLLQDIIDTVSCTGMTDADCLTAYDAAFEELSTTDKMDLLDAACASDTILSQNLLLYEAGDCPACILQSDKDCLGILESILEQAKGVASKYDLYTSIFGADACEAQMSQLHCVEKLEVLYSQYSDKEKLEAMQEACAANTFAWAGEDLLDLPQQQELETVQDVGNDFVTTSAFVVLIAAVAVLGVVRAVVTYRRRSEGYSPVSDLE